MRKRIVAAALLTAALAVAASTALGATSKASASSITVWLQADATADNWKPITAAANAAFQAKHPGVTVNIQYQTWGAHLQKFDATLAGGNAPDVIEMGNTEMTKYMAAGAFQDLSADKASFPNSDTWLQGLALSGRYGGKTYGVPYYAGSRVVTYRTDLFKKAGSQGPGDARAVPGGRREAGDEELDRRASRPSTSRAPTGTSRWASSSTTAAASPRR